MGGKQQVTGRKLSAISPQLLHQRGQHSLNLQHFICKTLEAGDLQELQISGEKQAILHFPGRPCRYLKKSRKVTVPRPACSPGNISAERDRRTPYLTRQTVHLFSRKRLARFVDVKSQSVRLVPNLKISEILHSSLLRGVSA